MEVANLVLSYIRVLVWPVFWLLLILIFKNNLSALLTRLESGEAAFGNFRITARLKTLESKIERSGKKVDTTSFNLASNRVLKLDKERFAKDMGLQGGDGLSEAQHLAFRGSSILIDAVHSAANLANVAATQLESNATGSGGQYPIEWQRLRVVGIIDQQIHEILLELDELYRKIWTLNQNELSDEVAIRYFNLAKTASTLILARAQDYKKS